ncbi:hypothetical protein [Chryseobacterium sp. G0240]|uniref:hypothetical protein n=1 Tax=Chryseobacterium sp. G0240 TaxID=2487066 RepID=UPI0011CEA6BE|nr:hypothetical protein [Chryseobacterium sp. G0240]
MATILVLLSSFLPFLNNLIKNFIDTESIKFNNISGARNLDLDSAIFFLAMPVSYLFIAIGGRYGAHRYSFYAVYVSCYFQLMFIVRFIFLDKNEIYIITQIALLAIFLLIGILSIIIGRYYSNLEAKNEYLNKTLDRYSSILRGKN